MDDNAGQQEPHPLREFSLKGAGYAYLIGDAALFASGWFGGRKKEAATGLIWMAGGLVPALYGKQSAERQFQELSVKLSDHLRAEGVTIPQGSALNPASLARHGGVIHSIETFLYKYPSQVLNGVYAAGAGQLLLSGIQHKKRWDAASGALVAAGALAGLLIPETKQDPAHPPQTMLEKVKSWVMEKPLRASGYFYMANNATLAMSALNEYRANPAQKSYYWKFLTVASYVVGNGLLAMSSTDHTQSAGNTGPAMAKLEIAAAQVIAAQPRALQRELLQRTAGYLAAQDGVKLSADRIARDIDARVRELAPGVGRMGPPSEGIAPHV